MTSNVSDILIEALPYIRRFSGATIVIKYGGHAMVDEQLRSAFAQDITLLKFVGIHPVIVHGGGPQINDVLEKMGIQSTFVKGLRVTDRSTMDVVEMVLGGKVNKEIVALIHQQGGKAVGFSGKDGAMILAQKINIMHHEQEEQPPEILDPGHVGEVRHVNPEAIYTLMGEGFIPVIAPIGVDESGETYNINADHVASKMAIALSARRLILLTDVDGLLDTDGSLITSVRLADVKEMIKTNKISGGMIPKMQCAIEALQNGVEKAPIINGTKPHSLLLELFTDTGIGTEITI
jgi:acetylglutamate kinase